MIQKTLEELWGKNFVRHSEHTKKKGSRDRSKDCSPFRTFQKNKCRFHREKREQHHRISCSTPEKNLKVVGSPNLSNEEVPISDFVIDSCGEYPLVCQKSALRLYSTADWLQSNSSVPPILSLHAHKIRSNRNYTNHFSFGFAATKFNGPLLSISCGYVKVPHVDVYDLESVDEEECNPLHSYDLLFVGERSALSPTPFAVELVQYSSSTLIAALWDGRTVYLDSRMQNPSLCTDLPSHNYSLSQSIGALPPINSVACVGNEGRNQLLCCYKNKVMCLWDLRKTSTPCVQGISKCEINKAAVYLPKYSNLEYPCFVASGARGELLRITVNNDSFIHLSEFFLWDAPSNLSVSAPDPKLAVNYLDRLLIYPNINMNSIHLFDLDYHQETSSCHNFDHESKMKRTPGYSSKNFPPSSFLKLLKTIGLSEYSFKVSYVGWMEPQEKIFVGTTDGCIALLDLYD